MAIQIMVCQSENYGVNPMSFVDVAHAKASPKDAYPEARAPSPTPAVVLFLVVVKTAGDSSLAGGRGSRGHAPWATFYIMYSSSNLYVSLSPSDIQSVYPHPTPLLPGWLP